MKADEIAARANGVEGNLDEPRLLVTARPAPVERPRAAHKIAVDVDLCRDGDRCKAEALRYDRQFVERPFERVPRIAGDAGISDLPRMRQSYRSLRSVAEAPVKCADRESRAIELYPPLPGWRTAVRDVGCRAAGDDEHQGGARCDGSPCYEHCNRNRK